MLKLFQNLYSRNIVEISRQSVISRTVRNAYSAILEDSFQKSSWTTDLTPFIDLEQQINVYFNKNSQMNWPHGNAKSSFTYLLLDPRITLDLPIRANLLTPQEIWQSFITSIFYVGKGKRSRPYAHLYQAVKDWNAPKVKKNRPRKKKINKKLQHILNIWHENYGVICLHIFQNILPVEAYTREAAMIQALGLSNLKNVKSGKYYGGVEQWSQQDKSMLGLFLLYKALQIFLNEGERQLRPKDID